MNRHLDKAIRELKADRRKAALMLGLVALGLLLWGRLLLVRHVPQTAVAEPKPRVELVDIDKEYEVYNGQGPVKRTVYIDLPTGLERDLFRLGRGRMGLSPNPLIETKSPSEVTDKHSRPGALLQRAAELRLQSVLLGPRPRVVINDTILRPGDEIRGLRLIRVAERHVLLECDGIVIRLRM